MNYYENEDEDYRDKEYEDRTDSDRRGRRTRSFQKHNSIHSEYLNAIRPEY